MTTVGEANESPKLLTEKFMKLRSEALKRGLDDKQLRDVIDKSSSIDKTKGPEKWWNKCQNSLTDPANRLPVVVVLLAVSVGLIVSCYGVVFDYVVTTPCIVDSNILSDEFFRPKVNCDMCKDIYSVPEETDITTHRFYEKYSFTGRPVLVKGAIANWTAVSHFSFKFFKELYQSTQGSLTKIEEDCQFFPYSTEFLTLEDALNMPEDRAAFKPGEENWYIGWSNCHEGIRKELRKHYERPYFLPPDSETVAEDWIFMGGPGPGAGIHLDYVDRPSWQAQISGTKTWQLVPTPECEAVCHSFNVTVHKGDIIVVDTNIWYHATFVHPGEISITIGSEFD